MNARLMNAAVVNKTNRRDWRRSRVGGMALEGMGWGAVAAVGKAYPRG